MSNVLSSFAIALGFQVDTNSQQKAIKTVADYERAVIAADARVARAKAENAKAEIQIAARRDADRAKEALAVARNAAAQEDAERRKARAVEEGSRRQANAIGQAVLKYELMFRAAENAARAVLSAFSHMTQGFDALYYQSQRTGASVESLKAIGYAFSQVGGTAQQGVSAVESFAKAMRENDGVKSFVKGLGVDTTKDAAEQLLDTVEKLNKNEYQVGFRQAGLAGISEENYELITRQLGALRKYREDSVETAKRLGLDSNESAKNAVAFQHALTRLQMTLGAVGEKLLIQLAPGLEKIAKGFNDWLQANPERVERILRSISEAVAWLSSKLEGLGTYLQGSGGDQLLKRWDEFSERINRLATAIERLVNLSDRLTNSTAWRVLTFPNPVVSALSALGGGGGIPGVGAVGGFNPLQSGSGGATPPDDRTTWQKYAPKWLGGKDAPAAGDGSRSFRNNNPGNIKFGPLAERMGATGKDEKGFARFPSYEAGRKAQESLLFDSDGYKGLTIRQAIARWAPAGDGNDPEGYAAQMAQAAGVGADTKLSDLTADQRSRFLDAQQRKEGWIPGADTTTGPVRANLMHGQYGAAGSNLTELRSASGLRTQVHSEAHPSFAGFLKELEGQGYKVGSLGGYNYRNIRGGDKLSQHAYGNAIDLNPGSNPLGTDRSDLPANVRELAKKYGLIWGMDWKSRKDPMHFEWNGTRPWLDEQKAVAAAAAQAYRKRAPALNMTPGGFNVNSINPMDVMKAPPFGTLGNTTTSNDNRAVNQTFHTTTTINEARNTREAGRVMAGTFGEMHALALRNAQSAVG